MLPISDAVPAKAELKTLAGLRLVGQNSHSATTVLLLPPVAPSVNLPERQLPASANWRSRPQADSCAPDLAALLLSLVKRSASHPRT